MRSDLSLSRFLAQFAVTETSPTREIISSHGPRRYVEQLALTLTWLSVRTKIISPSTSCLGKVQGFFYDERE